MIIERYSNCSVFRSRELALVVRRTTIKAHPATLHHPRSYRNRLAPRNERISLEDGEPVLPIVDIAQSRVI
jgi:hypothetical protein